MSALSWRPSWQREAVEINLDRLPEGRLPRRLCDVRYLWCAEANARILGHLRPVPTSLGGHRAIMDGTVIEEETEMQDNTTRMDDSG